MSRLVGWLKRGAAATALLFASCAVGQPEVPMRAFLAGELQPVADAMRREATEGYVENQALALNILAQCEQLQGDREAAFRHFGAAASIMGNWQTSGSETFAAVVGSEASKTWKGDPYEKVMNAFYLGLHFLWRGEPDNARAAWKKGILADGETSDEKFQADCALLFWLCGRASVLMGKADDAKDFFAEAAKATSFARSHGARDEVLTGPGGQPAGGNLVVLVECGMGPEKFADGAMEELARFRGRWHPAQRARVLLDGKAVGETAVLCDVDYQARTRGGTEMEGIRQGKAVFKAASLAAGMTMLQVAARDRGDSARTNAIVGGSLLLIGLLTSTGADTRHWPTLPGTVQALALDAPPGPHTLQIEFLDGSGRRLPAFDQQWSVEVPATGEAWFLFRSLPGLDRLGAAAPGRQGPPE